MIAALLLGAVLAQSPKSFEVKHELRLVPNAQLNGKFSEHHGTALAYSLELREDLALRASWQRNWIATRSGFSEELISKVRESPQIATGLVGQWGLHAGAEVRIAHGTVWGLVPVTGRVDAGAGVMSTAILLRSLGGSLRAADTGLRPSGTVGFSLDVTLTDSVRIIGEVRRTFSSSWLDTVDGCNGADLREMDRAASGDRAAGSFDVLPVSRTCNVNAFRDGYEVNQAAYSFPYTFSQRGGSSDILSILSAGVGLAYTF